MYIHKSYLVWCGMCARQNCTHCLYALPSGPASKEKEVLAVEVLVVAVQIAVAKKRNFLSLLSRDGKNSLTEITKRRRGFGVRRTHQTTRSCGHSFVKFAGLMKTK